MKILYSTIEYVPNLAEPNNFAYVGFVFNVPSKKVVKMQTHINEGLIKKVNPGVDMGFIKQYLINMKNLFEKEAEFLGLREMTYNYVNQFRFKVEELELESDEISE